MIGVLLFFFCVVCVPHIGKEKVGWKQRFNYWLIDGVAELCGADL